MPNAKEKESLKNFVHGNIIQNLPKKEEKKEKSNKNLLLNQR